MRWDEQNEKAERAGYRDIYRCTFTRTKNGRTKTLDIPEFGQSLNASRNFKVLCARPVGKPWCDERSSYTRHTPECVNNSRGQNYRVQAPSAYEVLSVIQKYEPGSFGEFCDDFGYNTDSIRDRDSWIMTCEEWAQVRRFFDAEELEWLQENAQ